ncbi:MAG: pyridoxal-phosphate dependent enzyme, partial [Firmicutes bacterium]|nr:pyridoxal-phosphate dependent enzyme [Bacillota bacterium]
RPGEVTFALMQAYVDEVVTVSDQDISRAMLMFLERMKVVVEGAGAVGLAAVVSGALGSRVKSPIGVVVSGGNLDVSLLSRILQKGLVEEGRQLQLSTVVADTPGHLSQLLAAVARLGANVLRVEHERWNPELDLGQVVVGLVLETRDAAHQREVLEDLAFHGYRIASQRSFRTKNFDN